MRYFRGGRAIRPADWNTNVNDIQEHLNFIKNRQIRSPIDKDKFVEDTLGRVDVSSRGGVSKVLEHDTDGNVRLSVPQGATSLRVGPSAANNVTFNFGSSRKISFLANTVEAGIADYTGWSTI